MLKFKIKKEFCDNELIDNPGKPEPGKPAKIRKRYHPGDTIELNCHIDDKGNGIGPDSMKVHRLIAYGIVDRTPVKPKKEEKAYIPPKLEPDKQEPEAPVKRKRVYKRKRKTERAVTQ